MVVLSTILFLLLLTGAAGVAQATTQMLLFNPLRVIFTDRQRTVNVNVSNPGKESITYTVTVLTMRKGKDGKLHKVERETEEEKMINNMIRFSPRRATIEPGKRQVIKLMVNKPKDLALGEYQTRLLIAPLAKDKNIASQGSTAKKEGKSIELNVLVASNLPVIIQNGDAAADVVAPFALSLKTFQGAPAGMAAEVKFSRNGKYSAFGNVFLHYISAKDPKAIREVGRAQGLAIYIPDTAKALTVPLSNISRQELSSGTMRVVFQPHTGVANYRGGLGGESFKDFPLH